VSAACQGGSKAVKKTVNGVDSSAQPEAGDTATVILTGILMVTERGHTNAHPQAGRLDGPLTLMREQVQHVLYQRARRQPAVCRSYQRLASAVRRASDGQCGRVEEVQGHGGIAP
jgi:hypothetical protein